MFAGFSLYVICVLLTNKLLKQTENMRNSCWYSLVILFTKCSCRDADNDDKLLVMDTDATNTYILIFAQRKINWKKVIFGLNQHNFALWPSTSNWEEVNLFISVMILLSLPVLSIIFYQNVKKIWTLICYFLWDTFPWAIFAKF